MFIKAFIKTTFASLSLIALAPLSQAEVVFTANGSGTTNTDPYPETFTPFSATDLADASQPTFLSITDAGIGAAEAALLNNGAVGPDATDNGEAPKTIDRVTDSITFNFDITVNTGGYDITGINTFAGWNPGGGGRSNQGFTITVTYVDGTTSEVSSGVYFSNLPTTFTWTEVLFTEDTTGIIAAGVKSVTFSNFHPAGSTGFVGYREIDIFGTASEHRPETITLSTPETGGVIQRDFHGVGAVQVEGTFGGSSTAVIEARLTPRPGFSGNPTGWQVVNDEVGALGDFAGVLEGTGGWYDLEVRAVDGAVVLDTQLVESVGIGEVFITAGQSNSANYGEVPQTPGDERVRAYDLNAGTWAFATDPQPVSDGGKGSIWPDLGTMLVEQLDVPVGFVSAGQGGTKVAQWLPGYGVGHPDYDPARADFDLYERLQQALGQLGNTTGYRAVLWHQGEADRATDPAVYQQQLETVISQSRIDSGTEMEWGVALASHQTNQMGPVPALRGAQQAVVDADPLIFLGADTDTLPTTTSGDSADGLDPATGLPYREQGGIGVHFSDIGLLRHAELWLGALNAVNTFDPLLAQGVPRIWMRTHGLPENDAAVYDDPDGDGEANWEEYHAGTDPKDANSALRITEVERSDGNLTVYWKAVEGKSYTIEYRRDLQIAPWTVVMTGLPGVEPESSAEISLDGGRGFVRVRVE
ncbi:MAG: sialate O-acetylesterase [Luteolibacter sp.]